MPTSDLGSHRGGGKNLLLKIVLYVLFIWENKAPIGANLLTVEIFTNVWVKKFGFMWYGKIGFFYKITKPKG